MEIVFVQPPPPSDNFFHDLVDMKNNVKIIQDYIQVLDILQIFYPKDIY